jgi:predicted dehydrogenase
MLRVGIVGCGKIADSHAAQIRRIAGCEIVGVCDRELLMARQLYERYPVSSYCDNLDELLEKCHPDVIHVTTPPQSHLDITRRCLESGCHVYVEKPFTLCANDAQELIEIAEQNHRQITVGHDHQFGHAATRMRRLVQAGFLGGPPVHMESYYCYEIGSSDYAKALLGDGKHWVRKLPGKLLHNIISHGIAKIAEFLRGTRPRVTSMGFTSPLLMEIGENDIVDELRVMMCDEERTTAYFTLSSQMRPSLHQFRIFGPKNGLALDVHQETLIKLRGARYKSYAERFLPPVGFAAQYMGELKKNSQAFVANDFHMKAGMKNLIQAFYLSIANELPPPISYREIVLTAQIMDDIFSQLEDVAGPARRTGSANLDLSDYVSDRRQ